jgi:ferredoxin-NADP reductase
VARAAVLGRLTWRVADVVAVRTETASARTLVLDVPNWPGHLAGQHVDVRLTADDGYSAQRSYSIANASAGGSRIELTVQRVDGGEVSGYLVDEVREGDQFELRGPVGGYFVWRPEWTDPVLLLAGGSGVVPLMAIARTHAAAGAAGPPSMPSGRSPSAPSGPMRLVYSVRTPDDVIYAAELGELATSGGLAVHFAYTRTAPSGSPGRPGRLDAATLGELAWPPDARAISYVCGPTGFVEAMADLLVAGGHLPVRVRTERFG